MEMLGKLKEIAGPLNYEEKKQNLKRKLQELESIEADVITELEAAEFLSSKKRKNEVENWLGNVQRMRNEVQSLERKMEESSLGILFGKQLEKLTGEATELIEKGRFQGGLVLDAVDTSGDALITTKLVGTAFQINMDKIWAWLMEDRVLSIGICGMGGVGKTTLMTHIHNILLERRDNFHHVCWTTVSQDFSIYKLQNQIAKSIKLDLSDEDDEIKRAAKLSKALSKKHKTVIILDDLWNYFGLNRVGIPVKVNGCKLILTTRSLDICRKMGCHEIIKVEPLSEQEAWELFKEKLGNCTSLPLAAKQTAKAVARECNGLPLGIITIAGSMRGTNDVHEWSNLLEELKESKLKQVDMENEVFQTLKFSYIHLNDSALQQCLLYCALFPEDFRIERDKLIEILIDEGIIERMKSRKAGIDKGHAMLNKLENACLLESCVNLWKQRCVRMHDLIRDMALQIMEVSPRAMVESGAQLTELPDEERWTEGLVRVSLMRNNIKQIPSSHSPRCPNLSTLLLCNNVMLELIADSFFEQLCGLKVLDLSATAIRELPSSISYLVNLSTLNLSFCTNLRHVPTLAKLRALKKLDLNNTELEQVPAGMEFLSDLRYLDLYKTRLQEFPPGLLPKLSRLQFFRLLFHGETLITVRVDEVACLRKLETLYCKFRDFNEYIQALEGYLGLGQNKEQQQQLAKYILLVGEDHMILVEPEKWSRDFSRRVYFSDCSLSRGGEDALVCLPENIQLLEIADCYTGKSLCLVNATKLKSLRIRYCNEIECLFPLPSSYATLKSLERLQLYYLKNLHVLFSRDGGATPALTSSGIFNHLKELRIEGCYSMRKLFPPQLLPNLQNLEVIEVRYCKKIEEIIAVEEEASSSTTSPAIDNNTQLFTVSKLRLLVLENLARLKSICRGNLICHSLQEICVVKCPELRHIPISLPIPSLKEIKVYPKEWWEAVEWGHPNARNQLQPYFLQPTQR